MGYLVLSLMATLGAAFAAVIVRLAVTERSEREALRTVRAARQRSLLHSAARVPGEQLPNTLPEAEPLIARLHSSPPAPDHHPMGAGEAVGVTDSAATALMMADASIASLQESIASLQRSAPHVHAIMMGPASNVGLSSKLLESASNLEDIETAIQALVSNPGVRLSVAERLSAMEAAKLLSAKRVSKKFGKVR
jgi:hypothetical protein